MTNHVHRSLGRRSCKLIMGMVCASFWIILTMCYYYVHHFDHDFDQPNVMRGILRRDTRAGVPADIQDVADRKTADRKQNAMVHKAKTTEFKVSIFPPCENKTENYFFMPGVLTGGNKLRRFTGRKLVPYISVFPSDGTHKFDSKAKKADGNQVIAKKIVDKLREEFLNITRGRPFHFGNIVRIERMTLPGGMSFGGRLFLLEVIAALDRKDFKFHSEYVLDSGLDNGLCHPGNYVINPNRKIHVILTVKNLGEWVERLVKEFEELQKRSGDKNFELLVADFNSSDIDFMELANMSVIGSKIRVLKMANKYNKAAGVSAAANLIQNPSDIVFLCDLHLEIPATFLADIRKHVIPKKMVFAPVVGKLDIGATPDNPRGEWDTNGFGLIAMTKSDWDMIGGINTEEFNGDRWGGEDWEMIDRIVESGLLVNRRRVPGLLHHYHNKTGMWAGGRYHLVGGQNITFGGGKASKKRLIKKPVKIAK